MSEMTTQDRAELAKLIAKAQKEGKYLHCAYQDLWFSPFQLHKANQEGKFVWGVVNWTLRDPQEKLKQLKSAIESAQRAYDQFEKSVFMETGKAVK